MSLTGEQIRAGRALARMEQAALADAAGLSIATVKRLESTLGPISANTTTETAVRRALSEAGVVCIEDNDFGPGVRLRENGHPLRIRQRVDEGLARLANGERRPLAIRLNIVESTIFAKSLGLEEPPVAYRGIPLVVDPCNVSIILAGGPNSDNRVSIPL